MHHGAQPPTPELDDDVATRAAASTQEFDTNTPTRGPDKAAARANIVSRGSSLGRYIVLDQLGAGGMGVVYAAYDPELDRKVALKVLNTGVALGDTATNVSAPMRTRLLREAQALAKLSHPHVVTVYDVGTFDNDVFMAMAYVDGRTLRQWLKEKTRSWQEIVRMFVQAGEGLAAAHRAGLTHRDFKPDNVIIDHEERAYVLDFGLVHAQSADEQRVDADSWLEDNTAANELLSTDRVEMTTGGSSGTNTHAPSTRTFASSMFSQLTEVGSVMGTPAYMPPEQHAGQPTDARSDQFSYCVALYEALYGRRPFRTDSPAKLRRAIAEGKVSTPKTSRRVPEWLRRAVVRGLAAEPGQRHASMERLLAILCRDRGAIRRRLLIAVGGLVLAGAALPGYLAQNESRPALCTNNEAALADVWTQATRSRMKQSFAAVDSPLAQRSWAVVEPVLDRYADAWVTMHRENCEATRIVGTQSERLMDLRMSCLSRRLDALRGLTSAFYEPDAQTVEQAVKAAHGLPRIDSCADTEALLSQAPLPDDPTTREQVESRLSELAEMGALQRTTKFTEAARRLPALIEEAESLGYAPLLAEARMLHGIALSLDRQPEQAIAAHRDAMYTAIGARSFELAAESAAALLWDDAYLMRRFERAAEYERQALALLEAAGDPPEIRAHVHHFVALLAGAQGKREVEIEESRKALAIRREILDPDHPDISGNLVNLAMAVSTPREEGMRESLALLDEAIDALRRVWPDGHPNLGLALAAKSTAYLRGGFPREAVAPNDEALAVYKELDYEETIWGRDTRLRAGATHMVLGERQKALEYYDYVRELLAGETIDCRWGWIWWGVPAVTQIYLDLGETEHAAAGLDKALAACVAELGEDHSELIWMQLVRGDVLLAQGQADAALAKYQHVRLLAEQYFADSPWDLVTIDVRVGRAQRSIGDLEAAVTTHRRAHEEAQSAFGREHPDAADAAHALARTLLAQEQTADAIELLNYVVGTLASRHGDHSLRLVEPLADLSEARLRVDGTDEATREQAARELDRAVRLARPDEFDPVFLDDLAERQRLR